MSFMAVSYTHLDVYKRQVFDNEQYIPLDALLSCRGMARMQVGSVQLIYAAS